MDQVDTLHVGRYYSVARLTCALPLNLLNL